MGHGKLRMQYSVIVLLEMGRETMDWIEINSAVGGEFFGRIHSGRIKQGILILIG